MDAIANMAAAMARLDRDLEELKEIVLDAHGCLPSSFLGRGIFGNQMMYIKSAFTNSKPIVKIISLSILIVVFGPALLVGIAIGVWCK
jgi:hypothetical protein